MIGSVHASVQIERYSPKRMAMGFALGTAAAALVAAPIVHKAQVGENQLTPDTPLPAALRPLHSSAYKAIAGFGVLGVAGTGLTLAGILAKNPRTSSLLLGAATGALGPGWWGALALADNDFVPEAAPAQLPRPDSGGAVEVARAGLVVQPERRIRADSPRRLEGGALLTRLPLQVRSEPLVLQVHVAKHRQLADERGRESLTALDAGLQRGERDVELLLHGQRCLPVAGGELITQLPGEQDETSYQEVDASADGAGLVRVGSHVVTPPLRRRS